MYLTGELLNFSKVLGLLEQEGSSLALLDGGIVGLEFCVFLVKPGFLYFESVEFLLLQAQAFLGLSQLFYALN